MKLNFILSLLMVFSITACSKQTTDTISLPTLSQTPITGNKLTLVPTISPTLSSTSTSHTSTPIPLNGTIVFTSTSRIYGGISLLNLRDGSIQNITGMGSDSVSWSPDSEWIAINGEIPPAQSGGNVIQTVNLFIVKHDGSEHKRLTQSSQGKGDVSWSPDGDLLIYTYDNNNQPSDLAIFDLNQEKTYILTNTDGYESHPAWSPNSKKIAYLYSHNPDQPNELWLMDSDGKNSHKVLEFEIASSRIDWSPDGQWLAFISARNSQRCGDVYIVKPDGIGLTQLTNLSGCALNVVWSPDGRHVAFIEQKDYFNNFVEWQSLIGIVDVSGQNHVTMTLEETWRINDIDW